MDSRSDLYQKWISIAVMLITIITVPFALWQSWIEKRGKEVRTTVIEVEFNQLEEKVEKLSAITKQLKSDIDSVSTTIKKATIDPQKLENAKVLAKLESLDSNIKAIQAALGSNLERSLSVPLFRKDLDQLKSQINERTTAASKEIDRIYDQNKWFLGLMGTMALGLLGLAVSNFLQARKNDG